MISNEILQITSENAYLPPPTSVSQHLLPSPVEKRMHACVPNYPRTSLYLEHWSTLQNIQSIWGLGFKDQWQQLVLVKSKRDCSASTLKSSTRASQQANSCLHRPRAKQLKYPSRISSDEGCGGLFILATNVILLLPSLGFTFQCSRTSRNSLPVGNLKITWRTTSPKKQRMGLKGSDPHYYKASLLSRGYLP